MSVFVILLLCCVCFAIGFVLGSTKLTFNEKPKEAVLVPMDSNNDNFISVNDSSSISEQDAENIIEETEEQVAESSNIDEEIAKEIAEETQDEDIEEIYD